MGIPGLWDILGDGEQTTMADFTDEHFRKTGRPLRIAIDEAGWRYSNLTPYQVKMIREKEPCANPIEKAIFWRVLRLLRLNIRLVFVFDGPHRPWKRNKKGGGGIKWNEISLLRKTLKHLNVPTHLAPAEAEAECASMQSRGIVDAVWTADGDAFMFGCTLLIREHRINGKRVENIVQIHRMATIESRLKLGKNGIALFAVLNGGDYATSGLPGCGPQLALKAAQHGLGELLALVTNEHSLHAWRQDLATFLANRAVHVPLDFPRLKDVQNYFRPKTNSKEELLNLPATKFGPLWDSEIDQTTLRVFLRESFNIWTRGYLNHIAPILLVRHLVRTMPDRKLANVHDITIKKQRSSKKEGKIKSEKKICFCPVNLVSFGLTSEPGFMDINGNFVRFEDWTQFAQKDGLPWDATAAVETEILEVILQQGLTEEFLASTVAQPTPQGRNKSKVKVGTQVEDSRLESLPSVVSTAKRKDEMTKKMAGRKRSATSQDGARLEAQHAEGKFHQPRAFKHIVLVTSDSEDERLHSHKPPSKSSHCDSPVLPELRIHTNTTYQKIRQPFDTDAIQAQTRDVSLPTPRHIGGIEVIDLSG